MVQKSLLLALALALPGLAQANNIAPGTLELKGASNLQFTSTTFDAPGSRFTTSTFGLETSAAYYLTHEFGVGLELAYDRTTSDVSGFGSSTSTAYTIGPKVVLDHQLQPNLSLFGEAMLGLVRADDGGSSADGWALGVGGGLKFFLSRAVSADLGLGYQLARIDGGGVRTDLSAFRIGVGLSVYLGNLAPAGAHR